MKLVNNYEILIVDDIPENLKFLSDLLSAEDYKVRSVNSGKLALSSVAAKMPDLILLDIKMPEMDGFEVCRALKSNNETLSIPIIFLSAMDDIETKVEAFSIGAVDYVTKPFSDKEVLARVSTHLELENSRKKMKDYIDLIDKNILTSTSDLKGNITYVSEAFCKVSGYTKEELMGKKHNLVKHPEMSQDIYKQMWEDISNGKVWRGEIKNRKKDGSVYWVDATISPVFDSDGNLIEYTSIRHDITDKKIIEELSITDQLTKLYNRLKIDESIENEIQRVKRYAHPLSVIILDIDYFKQVNDTYGHDIGDRTLKSIANIIQNCIRKIDIAGRWGGEEFIIIAPETNTENAQNLAEKIRSKIESYNFDTIGSKTASFGVASFLDNEDTSESLIKRADEALYDAKKYGRNKVCSR